MKDFSKIDFTQYEGKCIKINRPFHFNDGKTIDHSDYVYVAIADFDEDSRYCTVEFGGYGFDMWGELYDHIVLNCKDFEERDDWYIEEVTKKEMDAAYIINAVRAYENFIENDSIIGRG